MMMIVKKNLCWTQATLLKLEMTPLLFLSMEADHNKFLTMENMNMCPLCLSTLPILSLLGHQPHYSSLHQ
jgi:hypothetical protein